jgi:SNF2 family DNA or RNA helicase
MLWERLVEVIENKALKLKLRNPHRVLEVIPKSAIVDTYEDGSSAVLVKWGLEEAQVLKNLRIKNVPSPIIAKYKWPGTREPFAHQKQTAAFLTLNRRAFVFNDPGTGKTLSMIWAADYLLKLKMIRRVLVVCPVSVMRAAWVSDLFHGAMHRSVDVAHGTRKQREDVLALNTEFVIINFDGIEILEDKLKVGGFDLIIIDEANYVKTATTKRWRAINRLIKPDTWLWMATGTPASQSPLDAYGLVKMMHPASAPRTFGIYRDAVMTKVTAFKWVPKPSAVETVNRLLQPAIRYTKDQCLDLPDIIYTTRDVPLSKQQQKLYDQLRTHMAAIAAGESISAVNAAVGLQKLLQVSCGAVYSDDRATVELDISERFSVLREVIDGTDNKVLVFVPYINTLESLEEKLIAKGYSVAVIFGKISASKRADIIKRFQEQPTPRVLLIQPQAASHGITLHAADTIVWWGPIMSYETYVQANARIHRAGQKNKCLVVRLQGSPVEIKRYKALDTCEDTNESLLEMFKEVLTM